MKPTISGEMTGPNERKDSMTRHSRTLAAWIVISTCALSVNAAERTTHEVAARRLVQISGGVANAEAGADAMIGMIRDNPALAPYQDVFRAWFKKVFATGDFEGDMAQIYMRHFSEQELDQLSELYQSPLGRRMLAELPAVMKEGAELGMARAKEHESELISMLDAARAEQEKPETAQPPK